MASFVMEGHIKKLRKAGYLSNDIAHRLPDEGQLIPTPRCRCTRVGVPYYPELVHGQLQRPAARLAG